VGRAGQAHRAGDQGHHREERQDQEADVDGPVGDRAARVEDVGDGPPEPDRGEAGQPGAEQEPPPAPRAGPLPAGGEAEQGGNRRDAELRGVEEEALVGSGGHHVRADRRDGGDEHQRHG
jgi:hypothetical protein